MKIAPGGTVSTIVICGFIGLVNSLTTSADGKIQLRTNCGSVQFRCENGECIASDLLCDGRADCSDQSDETREECTKPEIICPEYAFRCDYGACVDGDAPCNGIDNCLDRSDELLPRCRNTGGNNSSTVASCSKNEFRCNNGQCIPGTAMCDGTLDCADRSDETHDLCNNIECPSFNFRCAYGACIDEDLKCNGVRNCGDGSDEDPDLCGGTRPPNRTTTESPHRPTTPSRRPATSRPSRPPCQIPLQPLNGRWQLHKSQCPGDDHCSVRGNVALEPGTYLIYSCNEGYRLKGLGDVFCGPEGQWSSKPVCVEIRCKPLSTASTEADCTYNDQWTSCEAAVRPRTVAKIACRNSYRQDSTILSTQRENVRCNARGQWEPEPIRCVPVCGVTTSRNKPLIVNGTLPKITDFPWHATLYREENQSQEKQFICGATIIQSDLLITAAHCVYDEVTKKVDDASKYAIATGNIFRDYNSRFHDARIVKKANVKRIYVNCNYLGLEGNYARDIAILHIDQPFTFSSLLMPICLDISMYSDQSVLEVGSYGKVAGFGKTSTAQSSQILQYLNVPYVPLSECKSSSAASDSEKFITIDKFCAGYTNGSSVCDGDSGGGLVFQTGGLWYLRGIVSVGIGATFSGGTRSCDSHAYSLYTKVSSHIEWIQDIIIRIETYNTFPSCPNRTINRFTIDSNQ